MGFWLCFLITFWKPRKKIGVWIVICIIWWVFFYCIKRGMYRLRLCLWLRFLWWWLRHNYWLWFLLRYRWWGLSRSGSRLRGFLNCRLWIRWTCWLYLSGCERWRLSRSGSRLRAFLNFSLWIFCTWVVLRDGEEGCDIVRSAGWEDKQCGASSWGSVCDAKLCYIKECEFCF